MGIRIFSSSIGDTDKRSSYVVNNIQNITQVAAPNPNPYRYTILKSDSVGIFTIIKIKYDGCTNYEGEKILVYRSATVMDLLNQNSIDPHFCENPEYISPIARFVPTEEGWQMAKKLCESL